MFKYIKTAVIVPWVLKKKLHLSDLIGNKDINTQLMIANGAARLHNKAMGHILFSGLAGTGKTTSAKAIANLSEAPFFEVGADSIKTAEELARLFREFPEQGYSDTGEKIGTIKPPIIFIDEAHRLSLRTEEMLGIAMENNTHTYVTGKGKNKTPVTDWVPEFTIICATTKEGELSKPFRDRFKFAFVFGSYTFEESQEIVKLHVELKKVNIDHESIKAIALRGRGTPRLLVKYLDTVHDSMIYMRKEEITLNLTNAQFMLMGIDEMGLSKLDIHILKDLHKSDSPQGLDSLAVKTNLDPKTISEVNEPYLIRLGLMERTKGGRMITDEGSNYLISCGHVDAPQINIGSSRTIRSS